MSTPRRAQTPSSGRGGSARRCLNRGYSTGSSSGGRPLRGRSWRASIPPALYWATQFVTALREHPRASAMSRAVRPCLARTTARARRQIRFWARARVSSWSCSVVRDGDPPGVRPEIGRSDVLAPAEGLVQQRHDAHGVGDLAATEHGPGFGPEETADVEAFGPLGVALAPGELGRAVDVGDLVAD